MGEGKLCIAPGHRGRHEVGKLPWLDRFDSLREMARCCPRLVLGVEVRQATRQRRPVTVYIMMRIEGQKWI